MSTNSNDEKEQHLSREQIAKIINDALALIKEFKLFEKHAGEKYNQKKVAYYIGLTRSEDLSNAKNDSPASSIEKMNDIRVSLFQKFPEITLSDDGKVELSSNLKVRIRELAGKLALNLIDISTEFDEEGIPFDEMLVKKETYQERSNAESNKRERFIAVVGAGASNSFTINSDKDKDHAIPSTPEAIERLKKAFDKQVRDVMLPEKIKQVADRMRTSVDNFEAQLVAMAQFSNTLVTKELIRLCGNKNVPCLGYEILAHMFKHRFVDVIVNFNYDELLDNAISEELPNPGDYRYIYTAGHCPNSLGDLRIANRIKQPIYVKCHGTISQPNSLRFIEAKDFMMEQAIQDHVLELFEGRVPDAISQEYLPVNLLVFGFSMRNHVFNQIISRSLEKNPEKLTIWLFDIDSELKNRVQVEFQELIKQGRIEVKFLHLETITQLSAVLKDIWEQLVDNFDDYYKPKGIGRHLFVDHIFGQVSPLLLLEKKKSPMLEKYYQDRLFVELFILVLQSNGTIHLSQLTRSRVGKFLLKLKQETKNKTAIFSYLKEMGMIPYEDFMYDTFVVENRNSLLSQEDLVSFLLERLKKNLKMKESRKAINGLEELKPLLKGILKRRLLLVNPQYDHVHDNIFADLPPKNVMNTSLAWIYNYRQNISGDPKHWDVMLSVSEEGGFLRRDFLEQRFENKGKFFELILAATGINERSDGANKWMNKDMLLSVGLKYRPWWLHNKHMVILLKRQDSDYTGTWSQDWELVEGFFYQHKMLSRRVNPVKLKAKEDLKTLLYMFAIYWRGTLSTPVLSQQKKLDLRVITRMKDIEDTITEILAPYEAKAKAKN